MKFTKEYFRGTKTFKRLRTMMFRRIIQKFPGPGKSQRLKSLFLVLMLLFTLDYCGVFAYMFANSYRIEYFAYGDEQINIPEMLDIHNRGGVPKTPSINHYNYTFRIANNQKCRSKDNKDQFEEITLLILIKSAIAHTDRRNAIRNSWGFEARFVDVKIRRLFILGTGSESLTQSQIDRENSQHKDIIQADFLDNYYNNTIKAMMGLKWTVLNCPKTQYTLLVDDDMYVSVKNLLKFLRNPLNVKMSAALGVHNDLGNEDSLAKQKLFNQRRLLPRQIFDGRLYGGYVFPKSLPIRYKFSKWYISLDEYPYSRYPPYVTAGAIAFSFPAVKDMYHTSLYTKHFRFDDIYLAILAKKAGIEPINNENFHYNKKTYDKEGFTDVIVSHGYGDPKELHKAWHEQKSLGNA